MKEEYFPIGINLGNTKSSVAVFLNGNRTTPSYVSFSDQEVLIGDSSYCQAARNPQNTLFDIKRLIGRMFNDPTVQKDMKLWPFKVEASPEDRPMIVVNYKGETNRFYPEEISSMVLVKMKGIAEAYLGKSLKNTVITVPAYFSNLQREVIKNAGTISGLNVLQVLDEPIAASIAYGLDTKMQGKKNILIFDLGGSTFDVSLVTLEEGKYKIKATSRDMYLGGIDFDKRITQYCGLEILKQIGVDINNNLRATRRLRMQCEKAKITLSLYDQTSIEIDNLIGDYDFSLDITRIKFESLCDDLFQRLIPPIEEVLKITKMEQDQLKEVILVGGSSNIPKIQGVLQGLIPGIENIEFKNPEEIIAKGAAIMANEILMKNQTY